MNLLKYVQPLQGTDSVHSFSNGNTLPLVTRPFGMTSWSLQTNEAGGGWFFHPSHRHCQGIRLTHQPSPWVGDYGHLILMAQTGPLTLEAARRASSFRPEETEIKPDYLKIRLQRFNAAMELTPTERCAILRVSFDDPSDARLLVLPFEGESSMEIIVGERRVFGYTRANSGGAADQFANYFILEFDCELVGDASGICTGDNEARSDLIAVGNRVGAYIGIKLPDSGTVEVKFGASFISHEQAMQNMRAELGTRRFEDIRIESSTVWERMLGKIEVESDNEEQLRGLRQAWIFADQPSERKCKQHS